jgi:CDP-4-dehydro-6-deoxyglucose reductase
MIDENVMPKTVKLLPSEVEFLVQKDQTILEAALSKNINLEYSCSNGQCGECIALLEIGDVITGEHSLDVELKEKQILTCQSFPKTNLIIKAKYFKELEGIDRKTLPVKVDSYEYISDDILTLNLRLPPTANFEYLAGQYIDLMWGGKKRSYSLASNKVKNNLLELHIKKVEAGVFSDFLFDDLKLNQLFRFYGPLGTFFVRESKKPIILLCTGSGFAPVKAMVEQLIESKSERKVYIYWGGRYRKDLYSGLPSHWAKIYPHIIYTPVYSREGKVLSGEAKGYCQDEVLRQHQNLKGFDVYACGSNEMIHDAKSLFIKHGLQGDKFHSDSFLPSN